MNIGLLSMQRVANYGSFWQAYCLKNMLRQNHNNNVEFIDIIPGEVSSITPYKRQFSFSKIKRIPYYWFQKKKRKLFEQFQRNVLMCLQTPNYSSDYDMVMIGSDEVFNFVQQSTWGFTSQLYGNIDNPNVNSYAACFGYTTLNHIEKSAYKASIISSLNHMKRISVRDNNSALIVKSLTGRTPEIHFDPVIVGDLPEKLPIIDDSKYILVYAYDFRMSDPDVISQVKDFAKKKGLKIVSAGFYQKWVDKNILPDPMQLLSYFNNADYVVTDTFHGTIFSVRYHKKFITVIRESNMQKLGDLLYRLDMVNRRYSVGDSLEIKLIPTIDYRKFEELRREQRACTEKYLNECMNIIC